MDDIFSVIFFIWIAFALLEGIVRKKKMPPAPTAPQLPTEDIKPPVETIEPNVIEIAQPLRINEPTQQPKPIPQPKVKWTEPAQKNPTLNLNFTPTDTMNAMILSEIFGKPKSLRKR